MPSGPPEWPLPGGWWRQPAKILNGVEVCRGELHYIRKTSAPVDSGKAVRQARKASRGK